MLICAVYKNFNKIKKIKKQDKTRDFLLAL